MSFKIAWKPVSLNNNTASTRIRCLIPMEALRKKGWQVSFYQDKPDDNYDLVVFNKSHDAKSLQQAQDLKAKGTKIVFDLCDNYFYNPKQLPEVEKAKDIIINMMAISNSNVASSEYLAGYMRQYSPEKEIKVIEDAVDEQLPLLNNPIKYWQNWKAYEKLAKQISLWRAEQRICLVWFGIAGGGKADYGMGDLDNISALLNDSQFSSRLALTIISNDENSFTKLTKNWQIPVRYLPWNVATFAHAFRLHDISIIPISKNPFTLSKTNNRLALSLYLGLPVIADSIPSYQLFDKVCLLDNWQQNLEFYLTNPHKRFEHVNQGRQLLLEKWSVATISHQWETLFSNLIKG